MNATQRSKVNRRVDNMLSRAERELGRRRFEQAVERVRRFLCGRPMLLSGIGRPLSVSQMAEVLAIVVGPNCDPRDPEHWIRAAEIGRGVIVNWGPARWRALDRWVAGCLIPWLAVDAGHGRGAGGGS